LERGLLISTVENGNTTQQRGVAMMMQASLWLNSLLVWAAAPLIFGTVINRARIAALVSYFTREY
jgi:hypothetical protein